MSSQGSHWGDGISAAGKGDLHLDDGQGCLIEWVDDGSLNKDRRPRNVEEEIRRYSEKEVKEFGDKWVLERRMSEK